MPDAKSIPFGFCHCGCGQKTTIPRWTNTAGGAQRGVPRRYVRGHAVREKRVAPKSRLCEWCGVAFTFTSKQAGKRFCGKKCYDDSRRNTESDFWAAVNVGAPSECWEWRLARFPSGYGAAKSRRAHRVAYALKNGPIPAGMLVCHTCDNRGCCNPAHLWLGTAQDNENDKRSKGRHLFGARHHSSKLSEAAVVEIRSSADGDSALARKYGVSPATVNACRRGVTWVHVPLASAMRGGE